MTKTITGCVNCPLYDGTGDEYELYCHHPDRPVDIKQYVGIVGRDNFIKPELTQEEYNKYRAGYFNGSGSVFDDRVQVVDGCTIGNVYVFEPKIEGDKNYNPITPDWCPLKKESITIEFERQVSQTTQQGYKTYKGIDVFYVETTQGVQIYPIKSTEDVGRGPGCMKTITKQEFSEL